LFFPQVSDFERELENELHRVLDPMTATSIPPRRAIESGGTMKKLLGGTGAALGIKIVTGLVAAAAAITVAGAATTGSLNPQNWGAQVSHQVQVCKDTLRASGTRGIGQCVSQFAKQHGQMVSSAARQNGNANGQGNGSANGNANSHGKNKGNANGHGKGKGASSSSSAADNNTEPTDVTGGHAPVDVTPAP
jgi:hypothetical protein